MSSFSISVLLGWEEAVGIGRLWQSCEHEWASKLFVVRLGTHWEKNEEIYVDVQVCLCDMYRDICVSVVVFFKFIRSIYNFNRMDDHTLHWRGAKISCELMKRYRRYSSLTWITYLYDVSCF